MSRKTPTLELLQNADIASPVRRSSRIAQNQKSSVPVVTRRASADSKITTTITSETRKSRRLSLSQEPGENSESGRSTPVFTNNESKTPSTRKRKDSTSSLNERKTVTPVKRISTPLTGRSTRSMSRSPQKSEETLEPTAKSRSRHYSVTEKVKPLEAIKEMETIKQSEDEKEKEEKDECDKGLEITSRNLVNVKQAIVILNPVIKESCLMNLNLSDKQIETEGSQKKDTKIINVIREQENSINELETQKGKVMKHNSGNSEIEETEIVVDTSTTEKSENDCEDNLVENKMEENSSESVTINRIEKNNCIESLKKIETTVSNSKDSTCELILSNISLKKNKNVESNASFSEDQSFQFNLNISIDNALKTPEKDKENKFNTSSCNNKNQENESPLSNSSKVEINSIATPKNIANKLNKTKTLEQSPKYEKSLVEIKNGTLTNNDSVCEPMDVDEYTLLEDLGDNNASHLSIKSPSKESKQINKNVYLILPVKNKKCTQNTYSTIKEDADVARTADDEEDQKETDKFSQNKLVTEDHSTENVYVEGENLYQGNLKTIPIDSSLIQQNEETPIESTNGWISEIETENGKEMNHSINQIKTVVINKRLDKTDEVCATNDEKNYDFKNNEKSEDLMKPIPAEKINIDKEKDNSNQSGNDNDKGDKIPDVDPFKYKTMEKIAHLHIISPQLNIDVQLENKVTDLINNKFNVNQEKSDSEVDVESVTDFLDNMAEEGEDGDESDNNSNEIVDKGESVGYSSSDEKETDDDSFDDSFIDDDVSSELLSGKEYDLDEDKTKSNKYIKTDVTEKEIRSKKLQKGKEKWSRIIDVDESDESLAEIAKLGVTNSITMSNTKEQATKTTIITDDEQIIENNSALYKSIELQSAGTNKSEIITSEQADEKKTSPKKTKKHSSLSISENLSFDEIRDRIEQVVDLFSSTVNNSSQKIYLNLSLNHDSDSDPKEDENKLSTSLQIVNASKKPKKSRRKSCSNSNIFTSNTKPEELELSVSYDRSLTTKGLHYNETTERKDYNVNDFQPCKSDEIVEETVGSNKKKRRSKNVQETLLSSSNKPKNKSCDQSENIKFTGKIFNDNLVILNPPKKKKKVECSEERVTFIDNNEGSFEEGSEICKKNKNPNENETSDMENAKLQSQLMHQHATNEVVTITKKKDKKKKLKKMEQVENIDTQVHEKKRKSQFSLENDISEVEMLANSVKKTKKQKLSTEKAFESTKTGDIKQKDKVKILSNVLINPNDKTVDQIKTSKKMHEINMNEDNLQCANTEENIKISTKKKKKNKTEKFTNTLLNINPSKSSPKLWIVDKFDTPPRPSQNRKLKLKKKNNSKESMAPVVKDFKNIRLYDSSRINRMETTQLLKKKKKQFDMKSA